MTPNQQALCIETNIFKLISYKSAIVQLQNSGQLQNNSVNGAMLITMNGVINLLNTRLIVIDIASIKVLFCNSPLADL